MGVLLPADARKAQPRYGFRALAGARHAGDGEYVGAIEGLRNWDEYVDGVQRLLDAQPTRAPTVGIAVRGAGAPECH